MVARGWDEAEWGMTANWYKVSCRDYEDVLKLDYDDGCTTLF